MKYICLQENLKRALFVVGNISNKNINLPILNNILISAKENKPNIIFISPNNGDLVSGDILEIKINIEAPREIKSIKYSLNNTPLLSSGTDKEINVFLNDLDPGYQQVHVYVCDDVGNCAQETINFNYLK